MDHGTKTCARFISHVIIADFIIFVHPQDSARYIQECTLPVQGAADRSPSRRRGVYIQLDGVVPPQFPRWKGFLWSCRHDHHKITRDAGHQGSAAVASNRATSGPGPSRATRTVYNMACTLAVWGVEHSSWPPPDDWSHPKSLTQPELDIPCREELQGGSVAFSWAGIIP